MTSDELRAAAMRTVNAYAEKISEWYLAKSRPAEADAFDLALAYLADHPADDAEPVTAEWLASVGFTAGKFPRDLIRGPVLRGVSSAGDEYWAIRTYPIPNDAKPWTRGHLRRLCAALGVPLTEAA
jgi:hypothetical protein